MQITERAKWDTRHQVGAVLSGVVAKIPGERRHELNDTMVAAAARMDTVAGWADHVCVRFGVALEEVWIDERVFGQAAGRVDALLAQVDWDTLRLSVEENPALITMIAKHGPLPPELAPPEHKRDMTPAWTMPVPTGQLIPVPSLRAVWTNQSELSHGADSKHGNVILFRREPVIDLLTGRVVRAPFLSGNSIRHSWRQLAADGLYTMLGLGKGDVEPELHHALTSGGVIDAGSEMSKVDPGLRAAVRHLCPAFELLGGIVEKQVCHGAWNVHDAILVCRENATRLMDPALYPPPAGLEALAQASADATGEAARRSARVAYATALQEHLRPALSYLTLRQYTKHIDPDVPATAEKMHALWDTELVSSGAQWVHHCRVHSTATDFARSCVSWILEEFAEHPYLAAGNNRGHGLVAFDGYRAGDASQELPDSGAFVEHVQANREAIKAWLRTGRVPESMRTPPPMTDVGDKPKRSRGRK